MTYLGLALVVTALCAIPALVLTLRRHLGRAWWTTTALVLAALVVLTLVFDNLMIAVDLYRYGEGVSVAKIGGAPVEDLAWPVVAALLLPALWHGTGRWQENARRRRRADGVDLAETER